MICQPKVEPDSKQKLYLILFTDMLHKESVSNKIAYVILWQKVSRQHFKIYQCDF